MWVDLDEYAFSSISMECPSNMWFRFFSGGEEDFGSLVWFKKTDKNSGFVGLNNCDFGSWTVLHNVQSRKTHSYLHMCDSQQDDVVVLSTTVSCVNGMKISVKKGDKSSNGSGSGSSGMSNENDGQQDSSGYGSGGNNDGNDSENSNGTNLLMFNIDVRNRFHLFILFFMICVIWLVGFMLFKIVMSQMKWDEEEYGEEEFQRDRWSRVAPGAREWSFYGNGNSSNSNNRYSQKD